MEAETSITIVTYEVVNKMVYDCRCCTGGHSASQKVRNNHKTQNNACIQLSELIFGHETMHLHLYIFE